MFTGIIESVGFVKNLKQEKENLHITIESNFTSELKIDQSIAHNGVCLTIVNTHGKEYTVTAIKETLDKSNLKYLAVGSEINLERAMILGARLDGHIVQGHVDQTAVCTNITEENGSLVLPRLAFLLLLSCLLHLSSLSRKTGLWQSRFCSTRLLRSS